MAETKITGTKTRETGTTAPKTAGLKMPEVRTTEIKIIGIIQAEAKTRHRKDELLKTLVKPEMQKPEKR
ncbi:MAG: hypothetical protein UHS54_10420 [Lachnospiraceae bacterium]|nr:hypothetical protein [Lachnospiraceae bacterium]